jgi:hypothetical protein
MIRGYSGGAFLRPQRLPLLCFCGTKGVVEFNLLDIGECRPTMKSVALDAK